MTRFVLWRYRNSIIIIIIIIIEKIKTNPLVARGPNLVESCREEGLRYIAIIIGSGIRRANVTCLW